MSAVEKLYIPSHVRDEIRAQQQRAQLPTEVTAAAYDSDLFWTTDAVAEQASCLGYYPKPRGHKVLVMLVKPPKTIGRIIISEDARERKTVASTTGLVLALGGRAYLDKERFADQVDCKVGEVILIPKYSGSVIRVPGTNGEYFNLAYIEDDQVIAGWGDMTIHAAEPEEPRAPDATLAVADTRREHEA